VTEQEELNILQVSETTLSLYLMKPIRLPNHSEALGALKTRL